MEEANQTESSAPSRGRGRGGGGRGGFRRAAKRAPPGHSSSDGSEVPAEIKERTHGGMAQSLTNLRRGPPQRPPRTTGARELDRNQSAPMISPRSGEGGSRPRPPPQSLKPRVKTHAPGTAVPVALPVAVPVSSPAVKAVRIAAPATKAANLSRSTSAVSVSVLRGGGGTKARPKHPPPVAPRSVKGGVVSPPPRPSNLAERLPTPTHPRRTTMRTERQKRGTSIKLVLGLQIVDDEDVSESSSSDDDDTEEEDAFEDMEDEDEGGGPREGESEAEEKEKEMREASVAPNRSLGIPASRDGTSIPQMRQHLEHTRAPTWVPSPIKRETKSRRTKDWAEIENAILAGDREHKEQPNVVQVDSSSSGAAASRGASRPTVVPPLVPMKESIAGPQVSLDQERMSVNYRKSFLLRIPPTMGAASLLSSTSGSSNRSRPGRGDTDGDSSDDDEDERHEWVDSPRRRPRPPDYSGRVAAQRGQDRPTPTSPRELELAQTMPNVTHLASILENHRASVRLSPSRGIKYTPLTGRHRQIGDGGDAKASPPRPSRPARPGPKRSALKAVASYATLRREHKGPDGAKSTEPSQTVSTQEIETRMRSRTAPRGFSGVVREVQSLSEQQGSKEEEKRDEKQSAPSEDSGKSHDVATNTLARQTTEGDGGLLSVLGEKSEATEKAIRYGFDSLRRIVWGGDKERDRSKTKAESSERNQSVVQPESWQSLRRHKFSSVDDLLEHVRETCTLGVTKEQLNDNLGDLFAINVGDEGEEQGLNMFQIIGKATEGALADDELALFISTIILTFRSYWKPEDMLAMLIFRFFAPMPVKYMTLEEMEKYEETVVAPRTKSVVTLLVSWIDQLFAQDFGSEWMLDVLFNFIELSLGGTFSEHVQARRALKRSLLKHLFPEEFTMLKQQDGRKKSKKKIPKPILPAKKSFGMLDIHPTEFARQLTLVEWQMFKGITPIELLDQGWLGANKQLCSPHIVASIQHFNHFAYWIASTILESEDVKVRAATLGRFLVVAEVPCMQAVRGSDTETKEECRQLRNYNAVMEIIAGLQSAPIFRLKQTWALLPSKYHDLYEQLSRLLSNDDNYGRYRALFKENFAPCVPYLGIHLTDLVFVDEGNSKHISSSSGDHSDDGGFERCNLLRMKYSAGIIHLLQQMKAREYMLQSLPVVESFITELPTIDESYLKERSLVLEPRRKRRKQ